MLQEMNKGVLQLCCIRCGSKFATDAVITENTIECKNCHTIYPILNGKLPILFPNPQEALAATYLSYIQFKKEQQKYIEQLDERTKISSNRSFIRKNLKEALLHNLEIIEKVRKDIEPLISVESLAQISDKAVLPYTTGLNYLKRDWCWLPEGEDEILKIKETLETFISRTLTEIKTVVFMGAGMGRLAWELSGYFEYTYAIDNSIAMASKFYRLQEEDIHFYEVNTKRVFQTQHIVRPLKATMHPATGT